MRRLKTVCWALSWVAFGCGDDTGTGATPDQGGSNGGGQPLNGGGGSSAGGADVGGSAQGGAPCERQPGPADVERLVIVGHPYDAAAGADGSYEILDLSADGDLGQPGARFVMGRAADREIVFTPDGKLGFAVQDDGSIGVFRVEDSGDVTVVDPHFTGSFYAESLTVSANGAHLYVVDPNFPENGGGLYDVTIGCDDTLSDAVLLIESKNARAMIPLGGDEALLAARAAGPSSPLPSHAHRISLPSDVVASADAFGDDDAILSWAELTRGAHHLILGDNSAFAAGPNRVAAVSVTANGLEPAQILTDISDPYSIAASPFDDAILVTSGFGDALFVVDYDPAAASPLGIPAELDYASTGPQLPGALTMVRRGALDGLVLIADVRGLYVVAFEPGAQVVDRDVFSLGDGSEDTAVGVGVQP